MPTKIAVFVITIVIEGKFNRNNIINLQFVRVPDYNIWHPNNDGWIWMLLLVFPLNNNLYLLLLKKYLYEPFKFITVINKKH